MSPNTSDLARKLHECAELLPNADHDTEVLEAVHGLLDQVSGLLAQTEPHTVEHRALLFASEMVVQFGARVPDDGEAFEAFSRSPYSGSHSALRPRELTYIRRGDEVHAEMVTGMAYEGAPDRAHGGLTAAVFDDLMGALQRVIGRYGYTKTLEVSYHARLPIDEQVHFVARLESADGGHFTVTSDAHHGDTLVASAVGVFTEMSPERFG